MNNDDRPSARDRYTRFLALSLATGFGVAYLTPVAKATLASAAAIGVYALVSWGNDTSPIWHPALIAVTFLVGVWSSARIASREDPDPSRAVIDEFAGQWCAVLLLPVTWEWMIAAFVLFRVLDVVKPFGIRRLERVPNGWGIMLDDIGAGVCAAAILNLARLIIDALM